MSDPLGTYRRWFRAAAFYNLAWATMVIALPRQWMMWFGIDAGPMTVPLVQVIGMMVGVYAIGYHLLARDPHRYCGLIWVGLAGKTFGPIGFVYYAITDTIPWTFGWTCILNDVIWWPVFWSFALRYATHPLSSTEIASRHHSTSA